MEPESRREWMLDRFSLAGKNNPKIKYYKFRKDGTHAIKVRFQKMIWQKINYIHKNPVKEKLFVPSPVKINSKSYVLPMTGKTTDVVISGKAHNYKSGTKIKIMLGLPNGKSSVSYVYATKIGDYKSIVSLKPNSPVGQYIVNIEYQNFNIGKVTFMVNKK